jgi:hypothetical protein
VIEGHVPVLGGEREFFRRLFVLGKESQGSDQSGGEQTGEEGTHGMNVALFVFGFGE